MGCDIHGMVEIKQYGDWEPVIIVDSILGRNYSAFGMFGVRGHIDDQSLVHRGMPDNASKETVEFEGRYGKNSYHSHSWAALEELLLAYEQLQDYNDPDWGGKETSEDWNMLIELMERLDQFPDVDETRIVVWFDS